MACLIYYRCKNLGGVPMARFNPEFVSFFEHADAVGAKYGAKRENWDIAELPADFMDEGGVQESDWNIISRGRLIDLEHANQMRAEIAEHELHPSVTKYNKDNGIEIHRKIVDADTWETLSDWEDVT